MYISSIPILPASQNYAHLLHDGKLGAVFDPGEAGPIIEFCQMHDLYLCDILITHHHWDHTNGILELRSHFPDARLITSSASKLKADLKIEDRQTFTLSWCNHEIQGISIPGHTMDHIAYVVDNCLFPGDTLFSAGCGRCFEGTPEMLYDSLLKLASLPDQTQVYFAHEYTLKNCEFALHVDPNNLALQDYYQQVRNMAITVPSNLARERAINPFLRAHLPQLQENVSNLTGLTIDDAKTCFKILRALKDKF